jgi:sulfite exporter TauE/SafE
MELSVAVMLILLGLWNIFGFRGDVHQMVEDAHPERRSQQVHTHGTLLFADRCFAGLKTYQLARPLIIGIVHGLAGSAAVALLVLATLQSARWAVAYLLLFGIGTIAGMMIITTALASALSYSQSRSSWLAAGLGTAAGYLSLAFGLFVAYQIGFVDGLFTHHPHWMPH